MWLLGVWTPYHSQFEFIYHPHNSLKVMYTEGGGVSDYFLARLVKELVDRKS